VAQSSRMSLQRTVLQAFEGPAPRHRDARFRHAGDGSFRREPPERKLGMRLQVNGRHYMKGALSPCPPPSLPSGNIALIEAQHAIAMMLHLCSSSCSTVLAKHTFRFLTSASIRSMATIRSSIPHEDRTATEPRENRLEPVVLSHIREVNDNVRLLRLNAIDPNHTIKVRLLQSDCDDLNSTLTEPQ